jgi:hypothetical protein
MLFVRRISLLILLLSGCVPATSAQSGTNETSQPTATRAPQAACGEIPEEDALVSLCVPASLSVQDAAPQAVEPAAIISLNLANGTPLRIALDQRTRVSQPGAIVHGKVVETVYAFDQPVIPAGSIATGRVTKITPVSGVKRTLAYANGNFSPFHKYEVTFDALKLPDGKELAIETTVSPGTAEVVHLVSDASEQKKKNAAARAVENAKQEAKDKVQEAITEVKSPGRWQRIKRLLDAQLPYRKQYLESGTRFNASLEKPLDFGEASRTREQLAAIGSAPLQNTILRARLLLPVSSATASRGNPVLALLTEPLFSSDHRLILPADTRLIGQVVQVKPARHLHHNGELRFIFEHIETPEGSLQAMQGSLEGMEVDRAARLHLDEEGGTRTTDSKTRYLSTGLAVLLAAAASHPDAEHGATDAAGDPGVRTAAGGSGFRLAGALISFAAKSTPVSIAFGAYGASSSLYANFISRGHDVVLAKDTPLEIGFGNPHPAASQAKSN